MNSYTIINPAFIQSNMMNNTAVIKQMISMFLGQGMEDFRALKEMVENKDLSGIKSKAHHIKPTMEYIGASNLRLQFQELENLASTDTAYNDLKDHFTTMEKDFLEAMKELKHYASTLS